MANVHINIGSNQNRLQNIRSAVVALKLIFPNLITSAVYESPAEGFVGASFYNLGINITTDILPADIYKILQNIEKKQGRDRVQSKFSSRKIDLDLVFYEGVINKSKNLPRGDILKYAFVLAPLAELNPKIMHPLKGQTYLSLWQDFQANNAYTLDKHDIKL